MKNFIITLLLTAFFATLSVLAQAQVEITPNFSTSDQVDTVLPPPAIIHASPIVTPNQDTSLPRLIVWLHGLAGSDVSWKSVVSAVYDDQDTLIRRSGLSPRKIIYSNPDYSSEQSVSIPSALPNIHTKIANNLTPATTEHDTAGSMAIAHSMGGIVARGLRRISYLNNQLPAQFNGIVTFGTPHKGAAIINNSSSGGYADQWILDGCQKIGNAYINEYLSDEWLLDIVVGPSNAANFMNGFCDFLTGTPLDLLMDGIRRPSTLSIKKGSPYIAALQSFTDTIPQIGLFGVEKEPVFWRTTFSMVVHDSISAKNPFGLGPDDEGVDDINREISRIRDLQIQARALRNHYGNLARIFGYTGTFTIPANQWVGGGSMALYFFYNNRRNSWNEKYHAFGNAKNWLSQANNNWKRIIGAKYDSSYVDGFLCRCIDESSPGLNTSFSYVDNVNDCQSSGTTICQAFPNHVVQSFELPNDGIVTANSAAGMPGSTSSMLLHSNHMQMRNDMNTASHLNLLFDGILNPFFTIPTK